MLHHEISGKGKETLVLLHGFMEDSTVWKMMLPQLEQNFRCVTIDLPGHGQSPTDKEVLTMDYNAQQVREVLDELQLEKVHLLGHSMGGYTALAFAKKYAARLDSLTLFFSSFMADTEEKKEQREKSIRLIREKMESYIKNSTPDLFNENEKESLRKEIDFAVKVALRTKPESAIAALKGMIEREDTLDVLKTLEAKIVVIAGRHDSAVKTDTTWDKLPDRENIKGYLIESGHNGHLERPEICSAIISRELLH